MHWSDTIARFTADWRRSLHDDRTPPELADYIPDGGAARVAVLADLIRIDLRHRWERAGDGRPVSAYRAEYPEVASPPVLVDLVCEEFAARSGHAPLTLEEFLTDYPDVATEVRERLADEAQRADDNALILDRPVDDIAPGQRIDDFDLLTDLGAGHLGRTFLARQLSMQRLVAVRFSTGRGGDRIAPLDHPHIARVFDQRNLIVPAGAGTRFGRLVYSQYVPGGTARDLLDQRRTGPESDGGALLLRAVDAEMERRGEIRSADSRVRAEIAALTWPETVARVGRRLAEAVDYADRHGVRYRVVTPDDVLFSAAGEPKLGEFADDGVRGLPYRAPEDRGAANTPDQRACVYSLGVLLWELLTGERPVTLESGGGIAPDSLRRLPADCPPALLRVLSTCLESEPGRRWSSGAILAEQLDLCLDPRARDLVDPPTDSLRLRLRRWRIPLITLAVLVPNMLASIYNIDYTRQLISSQLSEQAVQQLRIGTAVVNTVGFGFGTVVLVWFARHLIFVPYGLRRGGTYSAETLRRARTDTIRFGGRASIVIFAMWMLAGSSFPIVIRGTSDAITAYDYTHFVAAHALCGAIALVYPFFLVNFYVVRCLYPIFLAHGEISDEDAARLRKLRRRSGIWLIAAASIPLTAVAGATLLAPTDLEQIIIEVRVLAIASVIAFVGVYLLFLAMENDLRALERVQAPTPT
ncbi:serine/threonine protein kinase [Nocardia bovistercoris]|uniref:Serine/threonine protein kinase n=1 Tax=Nocardia bovistercoris TaxID=2785916 RepID=A0A931IH30_9NOCA|nr:serine/threonine protein kinase [Nocardia bovistercoris]MBH0781304.1 serine/threonine protein kinase [Nocardia bovistercoris]